MAAAAAGPARLGIALLRAEACGPRGGTALTRVVHRQPARLLPMDTAEAGKAGAVWCAIGGYGGGLLGGDHIDTRVTVAKGAKLCLTTQASTKVYRAKPDGRPAAQSLSAAVNDAGLLVLAPDPLVPFAGSGYRQNQSFCLSRGASAVVVDWLGSGRSAIGERWAFNSYRSRSSYRCVPEDAGDALKDNVGGTEQGEVAMVDAVTIDGIPPRCMLPGSTTRNAGVAHGFDLAGVSRNTTASIVAVGPRTAEVADRLRFAARILTARRARTRGSSVSEANGNFSMPEFGGDIHVGVSDIPTRALAGDAPNSKGPVFTVGRIVAASTEDVYRLLHACLTPLCTELGAVPYADRIHGSSALAPPAPCTPQLANAGAHKSAQSTAIVPPIADGVESLPLSSAQRMRLMQLTDATLPTGGFSHSGGIEAAAQLGILGAGAGVSGPASELELRVYAAAAARAVGALHAPFTAASHALLEELLREIATYHDREPAELLPWIRLNAQLHALLAPNAVACRASEQQGKSLLRVASQWLGAIETADGECDERASALKSLFSILQRGAARGTMHCHNATVFGLLGAALDLHREATLDALIYTTTRDVMSAAVRLNLVGPLRAIALQSEAAQAACTQPVPGIDEAAGTSPLLDVAHSCHDLLEMRLFQT